VQAAYPSPHPPHPSRADPITYPWLFYTVPEVVPALLTAWLATGASLRSCRRAAARVAYTVCRPCGCKPAPPRESADRPPSRLTIAALLGLPDGRGVGVARSGKDASEHRQRLLAALDEFSSLEGGGGATGATAGADTAATEAWRHGLDLASYSSDIAAVALARDGGDAAGAGGGWADGAVVLAHEACITAGLRDTDAAST